MDRMDSFNHKVKVNDQNETVTSQRNRNMTVEEEVRVGVQAVEKVAYWWKPTQYRTANPEDVTISQIEKMTPDEQLDYNAAKQIADIMRQLRAVPDELLDPANWPGSSK